jgi:hypothetical protein
VHRRFRNIALLSILAAGVAGAEERLQPTARISAEQRYDDDPVYRRELGSGDFITKLSPQVGLDLIGQSTMSAWYAADVLFHQKRSNLTFDHRGRFQLKIPASALTTVGTDLQIWRASDPTTLPRTGMARTLAPILYGKADGFVETKTSERMRFRPGIRFEGAQIYEPNHPAGAVVTPYASVLYRLTRRTDVGVEARYQYFAFGNQTADAAGVFGQWKWLWTRSTSVAISAGPLVFHRYHDASGYALIPRVEAQLAYDDGRATDLQLLLGHDLVGASGFTSAVWADYAMFAVGHRFYRSFRVYGALSYFRNGFAPGPALADYLKRNGSSDGYAAGTGIEWQLNRASSVQASAERISQGALFGGPGALERNIFSVRFTLATQ